MTGPVDQRRAASRRHIARMGGVVADEKQSEVLVRMDDADDDPRVIRDASGQVIRRL